MWLWLILGCGTPGTFGDELIRLTCERQYECAQGSFDALYADVGECRALREDEFGIYYRCQFSGCAYDPNKARACLREVRTADCEHIVDGSAWGDCGEVFYDCDWAAVNACVE